MTDLDKELFIFHGTHKVFTFKNYSITKILSEFAQRYDLTPYNNCLPYHFSLALQGIDPFINNDWG